MTATAAPTKPVQTFKGGRGITASVFDNTTDEGKHYFSVSVQKRYKAEDGSWNTSSNFTRDELPRLAHVVAKAQAFLFESEASASTDE